MSVESLSILRYPERYRLGLENTATDTGRATLFDGQRPHFPGGVTIIDNFVAPSRSSSRFR